MLVKLEHEYESGEENLGLSLNREHAVRPEGAAEELISHS